RIDVFREREPGFASGWAVGFGFDPSLLHAGHEGEREHSRGRALDPSSRTIDELTQHAFLRLILEQRLHHLAVRGEDARTIRMAFGQRAKKLGHPGSHPTVAAAPVERRIRRVEEQAVSLL